MSTPGEDGIRTARRQAATEECAQAAERLEEIRTEIADLLTEAEEVIGSTGCRMILKRAKSYWLAHITDALGEEGTFSMCSMRDTITELVSP